MKLFSELISSFRRSLFLKVFSLSALVSLILISAIGSTLFNHLEDGIYKEANNVFPLYSVREGKPVDLFTSVTPTRDGLHPHNSTSQIRGILKSLKCHNPSGNKHSEVTFEEFFYYTYAILHSPTYRKRYASFLKIDFPKIPVTRNVILLREISKIGEEISACLS